MHPFRFITRFGNAGDKGLTQDVNVSHIILKYKKKMYFIEYNYI